MVELIWADMWERFPTLRFSLTEGDIGWIPYFLWRAEHTHSRHGGWTKATFPDRVSGPADVFRKHFLSCFISDRIAVKLLDEFDTGNVCWESDFPHSDSNWPNAPEELTKLFGDAGVDDAAVNKITHENAMRHYKFDPFAIRGRDKCTVRAPAVRGLRRRRVTRVGRAADERRSGSVAHHDDAWPRRRCRQVSLSASSDLSSRGSTTPVRPAGSKVRLRVPCRSRRPGPRLPTPG